MTPKNVHEKSPQKRTSSGQKCPRDVTKSVHEMSPLLSTRSCPLCPRDVCHPFRCPHFLIADVLYGMSQRLKGRNAYVPGNGMYASRCRTRELALCNINCYAQTNLAPLVFCYQTCSDLLWEKIVLVIEKNFWNSEITRTICFNNERSEQVLLTEWFFILFLEVSQI